jgi:hypothetical protein
MLQYLSEVAVTTTSNVIKTFRNDVLYRHLSKKDDVERQGKKIKAKEYLFN